MATTGIFMIIKNFSTLFLSSSMRISCLVTLSLILAWSGNAAEPSVLSRGERLNGWKTRPLLEQHCQEMFLSVVEILDQGHQVALGTILSEDGLIATKASEFGESLEVRLLDNSVYTPEMVSIDVENDFALLKIKARGLRPVIWSDETHASMGSWVVSPHEDESQVRLGVVSAAAREVTKAPGALGVTLSNGAAFFAEAEVLDMTVLVKRLKQPERSIDRWMRSQLSEDSKTLLNQSVGDPAEHSVIFRPLLGEMNALLAGPLIYEENRFEGLVLSEETDDQFSRNFRERNVMLLNRLLIEDVYPQVFIRGKAASMARILEVRSGSAAALSGLRKDDLIQSIQALPTYESSDVIEIIRKYGPGETVKLVIQRGMSQVVKKVQLGYFDTTFPDLDANIELSGEISQRRTGFDRIIQHDIPLPPKAMGGPLMTLDAKFIGINIARYDRVATFALPASLVQSLVSKMK
jgi:S1-C subfamily serine protease